MNKKSSETNVFRMLGERGEPLKKNKEKEKCGVLKYLATGWHIIFVHVEKCAQKMVLNVGGEKER